MPSSRSTYSRGCIAFILISSSICSAEPWLPAKSSQLERDFIPNALPRAGVPSENQKRDSVPAGYTAAPYYPAPPGGWVNEWKASYAKAQLVVENMTLAEKINMTT